MLDACCGCARCWEALLKAVALLLWANLQVTHCLTPLCAVAGNVSATAMRALIRETSGEHNGSLCCPFKRLHGALLLPASLQRPFHSRIIALRALVISRAPATAPQSQTAGQGSGRRLDRMLSQADLRNAQKKLEQRGQQVWRALELPELPPAPPLRCHRSGGASCIWLLETAVLPPLATAGC